jgi:hypothetical protein
MAFWNLKRRIAGLLFVLGVLALRISGTLHFGGAGGLGAISGGVSSLFWLAALSLLLGIVLLLTPSRQ